MTKMIIISLLILTAVSCSENQPTENKEQQPTEPVYALIAKPNYITNLTVKQFYPDSINVSYELASFDNRVTNSISVFTVKGNKRNVSFTKYITNPKINFTIRKQNQTEDIFNSIYETSHSGYYTIGLRFSIGSPQYLWCDTKKFEITVDEQVPEVKDLSFELSFPDKIRITFSPSFNAGTALHLYLSIYNTTKSKFEGFYNVTTDNKTYFEIDTKNVEQNYYNSEYAIGSYDGIPYVRFVIRKLF